MAQTYQFVEGVTLNAASEVAHSESGRRRRRLRMRMQQANRIELGSWPIIPELKSLEEFTSHGTVRR